MTRSAPPRHLLVIAPQCPDQGLLTGLEEAGESLHAVLLDEELGVQGRVLRHGRFQPEVGALQLGDGRGLDPG
uniref:hypothetical protein n=1 Tax=Streptomyces sp. NRRL WC-3725 TaxID=1463933 RepID=UPI00131CA3B0